jgi:hypothetical protein
MGVDFESQAGVKVALGYEKVGIMQDFGGVLLQCTLALALITIAGGTCLYFGFIITASLMSETYLIVYLPHRMLIKKLCSALNL